MNKIKLTIGADPEIAILSPLNRHFVPASSVISPRGNEFGLDGNPNVLEIRPECSTDPLELVENIYKILEYAKQEYPQVFRFDLRASDSNLSIGGHIHLGHPEIKKESIYRPLVSWLDYLLSLPLSLVEVPEHRAYRINSNYGKFTRKITGSC